MFLLLSSLLSFAEPILKTEEIYVAPPTIYDAELVSYQDYIGSLIVSAANVNSHWVKRSNRADQIFIYDKHTIETALDTTCNYSLPLECGAENYHWVLVTDIFTSKNFATIVVKLYDENTQLIASSSKSSYGVEECKEQVKKTTISRGGAPPTEIVEQSPDKCILFKPKIIDKDIKQAVTILFASIHPVQ